MTDRITVRMSAAMLAKIDAWIAEQPGYVSRQDAVRRFVEMALLNNAPGPVNDQEYPHVDTVSDNPDSVDQVVYLDT